MKIGIDLGSTYSGFARYDDVHGRVESVTIREGDPLSIPSVVFIGSKGKTFTGQAAKPKVKLGRRYEYFKMLLNEKHEDIILSRGYDSENTPKKITGIFLESHLKAILKSFNDTQIENLYICVPEIWISSLNDHDGISILRDILYNDVDVPIKNVEVVSEPEAASAYFAYNYEAETSKSFNGYLLLIDYGGGTLDITLTEVVSSGIGNMEISYREGCGAGENHVDQDGNKIIGNAGVAFIQSIVLEAIKETGEFETDSISLSDPEFVAATVELEDMLKSHERIEEIEDYFTQFGTYSSFCEALDEEPQEFVSFGYCDCEIPVTYQCLYSVYKKTIEPVLNDQVRIINRKVEDCIKESPVKPSAGNKDNFKIAIVGGFGGCFFVKAQLYEIYNMDANVSNDPRIKNISTEKKEQAISLGAALLAAGKVHLQKTSRYSIGIYASDVSGHKRPYYGIKYHQVIRPGQIYYILEDDNKPDEAGNRVTFGGLSSIKQFAIEFTENLDKGRLMNLNNIMLNKLKEIPKEQFSNCGFSVDESDVVSFHIRPVGDYGQSKTIRLDSYDNMFETTAAKEIVAR